MRPASSPLQKTSALTALFKTSQVFAMKQVLAWLWVDVAIAHLHYYKMMNDFSRLR
jgi:hypothetical protein